MRIRRSSPMYPNFLAAWLMEHRTRRPWPAQKMRLPFGSIRLANMVIRFLSRRVDGSTTHKHGIQDAHRGRMFRCDPGGRLYWAFLVRSPVLGPTSGARSLPRSRRRDHSRAMGETRAARGGPSRSSPVSHGDPRAELPARRGSGSSSLSRCPCVSERVVAGFHRFGSYGTLLEAGLGVG